jgi:hypothetical protein
MSGSRTSPSNAGCVAILRNAPTVCQGKHTGFSAGKNFLNPLAYALACGPMVPDLTRYLQSITELLRAAGL